MAVAVFAGNRELWEECWLAGKAAANPRRAGMLACGPVLDAMAVRRWLPILPGIVWQPLPFLPELEVGGRRDASGKVVMAASRMARKRDMWASRLGEMRRGDERRGQRS